MMTLQPALVAEVLHSNEVDKVREAYDSVSVVRSHRLPVWTVPRAQSQAACLAGCTMSCDSGHACDGYDMLHIGLHQQTVDKV